MPRCDNVTTKEAFTAKAKNKPRTRARLLPRAKKYALSDYETMRKKYLRTFLSKPFDVSSWLHLKRSSCHIAAKLCAKWALLFWPTWPAAANWTLLLDERSFKGPKSKLIWPDFYRCIGRQGSYVEPIITFDIRLSDWELNGDRAFGRRQVWKQPFLAFLALME